MADAAEPGNVAADLFALLAADPLARHLGITLEQVRPGYARASMTVGPELLNTVGTAHGGATMALLDVVHAAVSNSEGTEVHRSSRTAVYRIDARGADGRPVATALARVFRTDRPWAAGE